MIEKLYRWMMRLAADRRALTWLALVCFVESSVFPIPPDAMLIPMVLANPARAWRYALVATAASVAGGWLGYAIGYELYETVGRPIFAFYHLEGKFEAFQVMFHRYGGWIVLIKGLTPIPFKLVTIASGATGLNPWVFTLASIGSRGMRFFLESALLRVYGAPIRLFIETRLTLVTTAFAALLVGGFLLLRFVG